MLFIIKGKVRENSSQAFAVGDDGGLARAVGLRTGQAADAGDGAEPDELARAARLHGTDEGVEGVGHGEDVDAVDVFEHVEIFEILGLHAVGDARIGDDDGGAARAPFEFRRCGKDLVAHGHVAGQHDVALASAGQRVGKRFELVAAAGDKAHGRPTGGVLTGQSGADAAGCAGNEDVEHETDLRRNKKSASSIKPEGALKAVRADYLR